jgi:hypothetical protein
MAMGELWAQAVPFVKRRGRDRAAREPNVKRDLQPVQLVILHHERDLLTPGLGCRDQP